jgi:predicted phosphoribosyltransferase
MAESLPLSIALVNQILFPEKKESNAGAVKDESEIPESEIVYLPLENFVTIVVNEDGELQVGHGYTEPNPFPELEGQSETKREQE